MPETVTEQTLLEYTLTNYSRYIYTEHETSRVPYRQLIWIAKIHSNGLYVKLMPRMCTAPMQKNFANEISTSFLSHTRSYVTNTYTTACVKLDENTTPEGTGWTNLKCQNFPVSPFWVDTQVRGPGICTRLTLSCASALRHVSMDIRFVCFRRRFFCCRD